MNNGRRVRVENWRNDIKSQTGKYPQAMPRVRRRNKVACLTYGKHTRLGS